MKGTSLPHDAPKKNALPFTFRGKIYTGLDDMPPEERQAYEQVLRALGDAIPTGAPDAWEEHEVRP